MEEILFVCTGNTCRSPMAEGLFRAHDGERLTGLAARSAGLFTQNGMPATGSAVIAAGELGADIAAHRSQQLTPEMVQNAKYIVCMTGTHILGLRSRYPAYEDKFYLLTPNEVSDPFGGDLDTYRAAAAQIDEGVKAIIERLKK